MRYRLMPREGSCTFHKIMRGRQWIGRVYQMDDGEWRAAIAKDVKGIGRTAAEAFDEGVAHHLGYASAAALRARNATVRHVNKVRKGRADAIVDSFLHAPVGKQMEILDKIQDPHQLVDVLASFTRTLRK